MSVNDRKKHTVKGYIVTSLHMNLQVANFQRRELIINLLQYSTIWLIVSWVPKLTLLDLRTNWMDALSERNSFVCRGLTVICV